MKITKEHIKQLIREQIEESSIYQSDKTKIKALVKKIGNEIELLTPYQRDMLLKVLEEAYEIGYTRGTEDERGRTPDWTPTELIREQMKQQQLVSNRRMSDIEAEINADGETIHVNFRAPSFASTKEIEQMALDHVLEDPSYGRIVDAFVQRLFIDGAELNLD